MLVFLSWLDKEIRVDGFFFFFAFDSDNVKGKWKKQKLMCVDGSVFKEIGIGLMVVVEWWLKEKEGLLDLGCGLFQFFFKERGKGHLFLFFFFHCSWWLGFGIIRLWVFFLYFRREFRNNFLLLFFLYILSSPPSFFLYETITYL